MRKFKFILCIIALAMLLSSCGTVQQEESDFKSAVSSEQTEENQISSAVLKENESAESAQAESVPAESEESVPMESAQSETISAEPEELAPTESVQAENTSAEEQAQTKAIEEAEPQVTLQIGETAFTVKLEDNETAAAFLELFPMTLTMDELHGNEKYYYLDESLPADSFVPDGIEEGDVMLYGDSCLVVFYESFSTSYSYTPIGHITDIDGLKDALGSGAVTIQWCIN